MARVCGGGDVAGSVPRRRTHPACMTHCAGPRARQAAAERQTWPGAEGARAGTPGRPRVSADGLKSRTCARRHDMLS
eukprot:4149245-Prymnesium_polylepis.1